MRWRLVYALLPSAVCVGCSFDRAGTADDMPFGDSNVLDAAGDSSMPDSLSDLGEPDTFTLPDSSDAEDTADVTETPPTGKLEVKGIAVPPGAPPVDLTAEGKIAWAHWGLLTADTFTRKAGSGLIVNGVLPATMARYDKYPITFGWSDGDPTAVVSATQTGIFRYDGMFTFDFSVGGSTESRVLRVYVATDQSSASATFTMSDASALPVTINLPVAGVAPGSGHRVQVLEATFNGTSGASRLNFRLAKTSLGGAALSLFAATVQ